MKQNSANVNWLSIQSNETTSDKPEEKDYSDNVTDQFIIWFAIGFILQATIVGASILSMIATCIKAKALVTLSGILVSCS